MIVLVHGFNVSDGGASTIDTLKPYFNNVIEADYGWIGLLGVRFFGNKIAKNIAKLTPKDAIGIGHSNGCMELIKACEYGAPFKQLILINPALDSDIEIPEQLESVIVLHNCEDSTVTMAKWLPWHYWGDMGRVGYTGVDKRVTNCETKAKFGVSGHSAVFSKPKELADYIWGVLWR